jgi:hypothetical protein
MRKGRGQGYWVKSVAPDADDPERHSGESRNPVFFKLFWTLAFAGVTAQAKEIFVDSTTLRARRGIEVSVQMVSWKRVRF